jgi:hypothetical protein
MKMYLSREPGITGSTEDSCYYHLGTVKDRCRCEFEISPKIWKRIGGMELKKGTRTFAVDVILKIKKG